MTGWAKKQHPLLKFTNFFRDFKVLFRTFKLHFIQLCVEPALFQQLLVSAHFFDLAFVHHDDLAGFADGG